MGVGVGGVVSSCVQCQRPVSTPVRVQELYWLPRANTPFGGQWAVSAIDKNEGTVPNVGVKGLHLVAVVSPRSCICFQGQYHLCGWGGGGGMGCHGLSPHPSSPRGGPGAVSAVDGQQPLCLSLRVRHESLSKAASTPVGRVRVCISCPGQQSH